MGANRILDLFKRRRERKVVPAAALSPRRPGASIGILVVLGFLAVFLGLAVIVAPILVFLLIAVLVALGGLAGAIWLARRMAAGDRRIAVDLLLLWALVINLPSFYSFDTSGLTRGDLLNPQSIARIILAALIGIAFLLNRMGAGKRTVVGPSLFKLALFPLLIFAWYAIASPLTVTRPMDFLLIAYRLGEWTLFLLIVVSLARNVELRSPGGFTAQPLRYVWPIVLFVVVITFFIFPVMPRSVYMVGQSGAGRLGNPFVHPNVLGILAGMGVFYAIEMRLRFRGWYVVMFLAVLAATYSRGAWLGFIVAAGLYLLLRSRPGIPRVLSVIAFGIVITVAYVGKDAVWEAVAQVASRSNRQEDLTSASERTLVWRAADVLIRQSPWLGHGYIVGPKKLNDVMASGSSGQYFRANHAHNEFIQALIDAGVPAALLTLGLLLRWLFLMRALSRDESSTAFLRCSVTWMVQVLAYGMLTPLMSMHLMVPAALMVYLYVAAEWKYRALPRLSRLDRIASIHPGGGPLPGGLSRGSRA